MRHAFVSHACALAGVLGVAVDHRIQFVDRSLRRICALAIGPRCECVTQASGRFAIERIAIALPACIDDRRVRRSLRADETPKRFCVRVAEKRHFLSRELCSHLYRASFVSAHAPIACVGPLYSIVNVLRLRACHRGPSRMRLRCFSHYIGMHALILRIVHALSCDVWHMRMMHSHACLCNPPHHPQPAQIARPCRDGSTRWVRTTCHC